MAVVLWHNLLYSIAPWLIHWMLTLAPKGAPTSQTFSYFCSILNSRQMMRFMVLTPREEYTWSGERMPIFDQRFSFGGRGTFGKAKQ